MADFSSDGALKAPAQHSFWQIQYWSLKKKLVALVLILVVIIGLAVGLGVGLTRGGGDEGEGGGSTPTTTSTPSPPTGNTTVKWQPAVGATWQIELLYQLNDTSYNVDIYDIDLFNNNKSIVSGLQAKGRKVICYFSAGSYENWRPDKDDFKDSDLGKTLDGWPNEKWIDLNSDNVREIMLKRLDMAQSRGCDGVDPDNVDGYDNDNGLDLTEQDSIDYMHFLANATHSRGMSIGLKNAGGIISSVLSDMQWSVNEQCAQYQECDTYAAFTNANKPVFHLEYPKGDNTDDDQNVTTKQKQSACTADSAGNFSTLIKNMNLDNWMETC